MPHQSAFEFALPDHGVVELLGADAATFCHAQFSSDVNMLVPGQWQWSSWLTPKGRVIALFALCRIAVDRLLLVLPDAPAVEVAAGLKRFVFRKKVQVSVSPLHVTGVLAVASRATGHSVVALEEEIFELNVGTESMPRHWRLQPLPAPPNDNAASSWRAFDLRTGLARLDPAQREQWTPQQLSLDRFAAYSVKKGCYPGQEIVARTHFLGKAKRQLVLMQADSAVQPGQRISDGERELGDVVSVATTDSNHFLLAVMPLERATDQWKIGDARAWECPLLDVPGR